MNELLGWNEDLPGEAYKAVLRRGYTPMDLVKIKEAQARKFKPNYRGEDRGDYFQQFMALQNNPEALFTATANLPETPFGPLGQYLNI